jgi:hypothetical protein
MIEHDLDDELDSVYGAKYRLGQRPTRTTRQLAKAL